MGEAGSGSGVETAPAEVMDPSRVLATLMGIGQLKSTVRTGWVLRGVPQPESVADHSWRMATTCLLLAGRPGAPSVDRTRCIAMCLVHDLAEAVVGDLTPADNVSKVDKHKMEQQGLAQLLEPLGSESEAARDVTSLWDEYEGASSPEARFVKDVDKLDMALQAWQYELNEPTRQLPEFYDSVQGKLHYPQLAAVFAELMLQRSAEASVCGGSSDGEGDVCS